MVLPRIAARGIHGSGARRFPDYQTRPALGLLPKDSIWPTSTCRTSSVIRRAVGAWEGFYDHVVMNFGLSKKVSLEGISRGGLFVYNWAAKHADRVNAIYCESPVCDLKSWPGGKGKGLGIREGLGGSAAAYSLSEAQMLKFADNPIGEARGIAARKIPILHVVNDRDQLVPPSENSDIFAERYRSEGGPIEVYRNAGMPDTLNGHHFPLDDAGHIVNFVLATQRGWSASRAPG